MGPASASESRDAHGRTIQPDAMFSEASRRCAVEDIGHEGVEGERAPCELSRPHSPHGSSADKPQLEPLPREPHARIHKAPNDGELGLESLPCDEVSSSRGAGRMN